MELVYFFYEYVEIYNDLESFNCRGLYRMKQFYEIYKDEGKSLVEKIMKELYTFAKLYNIYL